MKHDDDYNDSGFKGEYLPGDSSTIWWAVGILIANIVFGMVLLRFM